MSLEGRVIEFLDSDQLRFAYVRKQERDKLHLIDPRGRNLSVGGDRVVIVHRPASEGDFPALAKQISEKVTALKSEVDVELLWQSIGTKQREIEPSELAELFFSETSPEAASAVFRALSEDTLFFRRKGVQFVPKTEEQVSTELTRRQRQKDHELFREQAANMITRLLKSKDAQITPEMQPIIDRIHNWLKQRTGDEVGTLLEEIAGLAKARDAAYEILVRAGRVDPNSDRFLVIAGIDERFPPHLAEAAGQLPAYVHSDKRVDYRAHGAVTIDDEDTREVDDALTVYRSGNEIIAGIHIADVSAFVSKGGLLDTEAARRSSTIYLPAVSVRMFPERLSTDLASLTAGTEKPAFTVEVRFDEQGVRLGYRIVITTIRLERRLSYDQADIALSGGDELLGTLHRIAYQLQTARAERGAITFRRPELKVRVRDGEIQVKKIDPNSPSRFLVSEMMILANGLAADFAAANSLPVIFRTQEARDALAIDDTPVVEALAFERLRKTFKRSRLSLTPGTHSGLGLTAYTQASSPIRRYADLVTQQQFTAFLSGEPTPYSREELLQILSSAEAAEQEIRAIEDRSTNYWLLEFLARQKKDEPLAAVVLDAKGNIEIEDYYIRARITGLNRTPGDTIRVRIESIDPASGDIRFKMADF
ncbi:MAG: RNB domain-containing ribonuclease [Acidobacteria bacterium]|nr:RNB domain-containing ribonuclease [Acidobacteriota bacterium]